MPLPPAPHPAADATSRVSLPPLVDTHCHLAWDSYEGDLEAVLDRARTAGVLQAVVVATDVGSARASAALCEGRPGLYPSTGIHPNDVPETWREDFAEIEAMARSKRFVALGETGLDYYRDAVPPSRQREAFLAHAHLALSLDLPVIVHVRDQDGRWAAYDDAAAVLREVEGVRAVIHCFTGDAAHAQAYVELGAYVSFSGILTFPKGENVREAARVVPLDRMLVETDAPFLAPVPHRGERNEPSYVADTARRLADVLGRSEADVRRATTENAQRLFRLGSRTLADPHEPA